MNDQLPVPQTFQLPIITEKRFRKHYKDKDVALRGPIPLPMFLEWLSYAKSVTVSTPIAPDPEKGFPEKNAIGELEMASGMPAITVASGLDPSTA